MCIFPVARNCSSFEAYALNIHNSENAPYDLTIIGAEVVETLIAYYASQYKLRICVIEKNCDVGAEATKTNQVLFTADDDKPYYAACFVVNAAGLFSDIIARMIGKRLPATRYEEYA